MSGDRLLDRDRRLNESYLNFIHCTVTPLLQRTVDLCIDLVLDPVHVLCLFRDHVLFRGHVLFLYHAHDSYWRFV